MQISEQHYCMICTKQLKNQAKKGFRLLPGNPGCIVERAPFSDPASVLQGSPSAPGNFLDCGCYHRNRTHLLDSPRNCVPSERSSVPATHGASKLC